VVEMVGAEDITVEGGAASASAASSSHTISSFSSVAEDDDVAIAGWPKKTVVEVTKELRDELLIPWGVGEEIFLI
jgi:hypothetical protein